MHTELIQNKIYEIRGQKVMLDFDLAALYEVETKRLNEQVKRNISRFPEDFMFRLSKEEWGYIQLQMLTEPETMRSLIATASQKKRNITITPYAFTEHGVTMLAMSGILKSEEAVQVNIAIVRVFILLRNLSMHYKDIAQKLAELEKKYDMQFLDIYSALNKLTDKKVKMISWEEREKIGFIKPKNN